MPAPRPRAFSTTEATSSTWKFTRHWSAVAEGAALVASALLEPEPAPPSSESAANRAETGMPISFAMRRPPPSPAAEYSQPMSSR